MKTAYFDCHSGVSGDMILGALLDAGLELDRLEEELSKLGLTGYRLHCKNVTRSRLAATKFDVESESGQRWRGLDDIRDLIEDSSLSQGLIGKAVMIFTALAEAEAAAHGISSSEVHFHEVGALDAIIDVVGSVVGLDLLGIERVLSSPLNLGGGMVRCSHGYLPVPAPAVVKLLEGIPVYSDGPEMELTTPTGAAILSMMSETFGPLPPMEMEATGSGAGAREFPQMPNVLRVFIGRTVAVEEEEMDNVVVIESNIDDMNPELYSPFMDKAFKAGALDVFLTPILMKKGRPGVKITILTAPDKEKSLRNLLFRETTSFGLRMRRETREKLKRKMVAVDTIYGKVDVKVGTKGGEITQVSPEAESCARLAADKNVPLKSVYDEAKKAAIALHR